MTGTDHFGMVEVQHAPSKGNILEGSPNNNILKPGVTLVESVI